MRRALGRSRSQFLPGNGGRLGEGDATAAPGDQDILDDALDHRGGWWACATSPETDLVPELVPYAADEVTFSKPGYAGISDDLAACLRSEAIGRVTIVGIVTDMCVLKVALDVFDLMIEPFGLVECYASTAGPQAHLAGLAVLA